MASKTRSRSYQMERRSDDCLLLTVVQFGLKKACDWLEAKKKEFDWLRAKTAGDDQKTQPMEQTLGCDSTTT